MVLLAGPPGLLVLQRFPVATLDIMAQVGARISWGLGGGLLLCFWQQPLGLLGVLFRSVDSPQLPGSAVGVRGQHDG